MGLPHIHIPCVFSPALNPDETLFITLFAKYDFPELNGPLKLKMHNFSFLNSVNKFMASVVGSNIPSEIYIN